MRVEITNAAANRIPTDVFAFLSWMNSIKNLTIKGVNVSPNTVKKLRVVEIMKSDLNVQASALKSCYPFLLCLTSFQFLKSSSSLGSTSYISGMVSRSF